MAPVRVGGRAATPGGGRLSWSAAEGARGVRWREAAVVDGRLVRDVLMEVDPDGRSTRLEVTTVAGLLTLHPGADGATIHGNVVGPDGVRHLAYPWGPSRHLLVIGSPVVAAIAVRGLIDIVAPEASGSMELLRIDDALEPRPERWAVRRAAVGEWTLSPPNGAPTLLVSLDDGGFPILPDAERWPLEA